MSEIYGCTSQKETIRATHIQESWDQNKMLQPWRDYVT